MSSPVVTPVVAPVVMSKEADLKAIFSQATQGNFRNIIVLHGRSFSAELAQLRETENYKNVLLQSGIPQNPTIEYVCTLSEKLSISQEDLVIAMGGGSIIDTSKLLVALSSGVTVDCLLDNRLDSTADVPSFWVVPTTAGSGSEATHFAVVYKEGKKISVAQHLLLPKRVFLNASLTLSCPPSVTIASGVDALCQSIESFWAPLATDESKKNAIEALGLIVTNLPRVVDAPNDLQARNSMLNASHMAGKAINITKTTAGHALSYGITSELGIPHGIAVLLVMGPLIQLMDKKFHFFNENSSPLDDVFLPWGNGFVSGFLAFRLGMLEVFTACIAPLKKEFLKDLTLRLMSHVNLERLKNHPVLLEDEDIHSIYTGISGDIHAMGAKKQDEF